MKDLIQTYERLLDQERNKLSEYTVNGENHSREDREGLLITEAKIHLITDFLYDLKEESKC